MSNRKWLSKLMGKVGDKLLDTAAGVLATVVLSIFVVLITLLISTASANPQGVLTVGVVLLAVLNIAWAILSFQRGKHSNTCKSGNIWWLGQDLTTAMSWIYSEKSTKNEIDHGLLKCHHHAVQIGLGENIVSRLQRLRDEARSYSLSDWTPTKRQDAINSLVSIRNDIGRIMQENLRDFDAGPSLI